jgi:transmembrane sensor
MEFLEYEIEDLLQDPSFCNYCQGTDEQAVCFWEEWIAAHPGKQETCKQAKELYYLLNGNISSAQYLRDSKQFRARMDDHILAPRIGWRFKKGLLFAGTVAATIILLITIAVLKNQPSPIHKDQLPVEFFQTTGEGERKSFQLPDGSKVMLNAGSSLRLANNFNVSTREIQLEGEAFFDVSHDSLRPFIIHTSSMDVRVVGTLFNVRAYPMDKVTETSLLRGSVMVFVKGSSNKPIILHPNEKIILSNGLIGPADIPAPSQANTISREVKKYKIAGLTYNESDSSSAEFSWTENRLIFSHDNFEEIASRLERWYNVSIRFVDEAPKQYEFTGTFDRKTIEQVLDALQLSRRFEYEIKADNQIIIKK